MMDAPTPPQMASLEGGKSHFSQFLWRNGRLVPWDDATVHVNAVGHASVSAVFEGIKAYKGDHGRLLVFRLRDHLKRLLNSAKLCRLKTKYTLCSIEEAVNDLIIRNKFLDDTYVRPWIFPKGIFREHITPAWTDTELAIDTWTFKSQLRRPSGCKACISSWVRVGGNAMPYRVKAFSNYHNGRLATMEARSNGYDWPILLNSYGNITEAPGACLAIVRGDTLITPDIASGVLESITRDTVIKLVSSILGLAIQERPVDRGEVYVADEVFFMGTGWEVLPVVSVDGLTIGNGEVGQTTKVIAGLYDDAVRGRLLHSQDWCTPV